MNEHAPITKEFIAPLLRPVTYKRKMTWWQRMYKWRTTQRHWRIDMEDWIYWDESLQLFVKMPMGFTFDGASVPKTFHTIINATDALFFGSIPHDFVYRFNQLIVCSADWEGNCTEDWFFMEPIGRARTDRFLYDLPLQLENRKIPNGIAYGIIRSSGWVAWSQHRKRGYFLNSVNPDPKDELLTKVDDNYDARF